MSDATLSSGALPALWRYPERAEDDIAPLDHWLKQQVVGAALRCTGGWRQRRLERVAHAVTAAGAACQALDDAALAAAAREAGIALRRRASDRTALVRLFALVQEAAARSLGFRPYETQVMGAAALWHGVIAEMATGEGKTAAAALCAAAAALAARAVHVITVNDYLAGRDASTMAPLFGFLGLSVAAVVGGMSADSRRAAYGAAICYGTSKEIVFDHLRDRLALGPERGALRLRLAGVGAAPPKRLLRGLDFAIVDEADSVLVDAARTPLILSGEQESQVDEETAGRALVLAERLELGRDWLRPPSQLTAHLTEAGEIRLAALVEAEPWHGGPWTMPRLREELVRHALAARHLFRAGEHYLVRDGHILIIDEFTGRVMPDRQWADGLHQMIEAKEGCGLTRRRVTLARLTYQRFFPRYRHLCGMTGTAAEVAGELWAVYALPVARIPTHRPSRRVRAPDRLLWDASAKWRAVAVQAGALRAAGRPVLIGTRTVAAAQRASAALTAAGLPHAVLSAAQDAAEAATIAEAGSAGRITVATNMAGRGTDIHISPEVVVAGGLAVLLTERHEAGRIDRQLAGHAARQGDPGSVAAILALDDPLLEAAGPLPRLLAHTGGLLRGFRLGALLAGWGLRRAQKSQERAHAAARQALLRQDRMRADRLGFAGVGE
ncbi:MAG TPA: DEAD/DEAH box helicase [Acetobacteraceae bacterium]